MSTLRLEVYLAATPKRRVLVSIAPDATLDALYEAIAVRINVKPELCCLGETDAAIVAVGDLRDGDVLRIVEPAAAPDSETQGSHELVEEPRHSWRSVVQLLLTVVIFVVMEESFQRWVYHPYFRPEPELQGIRGERVSPEDDY